MISFKDITLADKDTITSFTMKSDRRNCDLSFSNLCSWRFLYDTKFAVADNFLVFKFWAGEQLAYMMPIGTGDMSMDRRHCVINVKRDKLGKLVYTLRDAPSLTGTFLMNEVLGDKDRIRIEDGAIVTIGATTFILRAAESE